MLERPPKGQGALMLEDLDPAETREWVEALDSVLAFEGADRAFYLLDEVTAEARRKGAPVPYSATTPYLNTIPPDKEVRLSPRELAIDHRIRSMIRWNALAMVLRANAESSELGGHIASFQSAATLYDVGFQHFFRGASESRGGDLLFIQGHSSPGIYARSFVEGRLTEEQLTKFRQEVDGGGLSSYPHPWLMPDYWQMPTVSMGLGPIMAIYQARFLKYLACRGLADTADRKVWAFLGDGETDEPESLGAIALASREKLDNLIFVINCNLQRLDGPVRGNGKIIQELEGIFRGAGWNVIKTIWGSGWDPLIARDSTGLLLKRMEEAVDGEYQDFKSKNGAYVREKFFGKYPELLEMVAGMTDDEIWALNRGGHDPVKVYAAYSAAVRHVGQPTVILAKTIKGYGMGESGEGQNITHQQKHMADSALAKFRDRFGLPLTDEQLAELPFLRFDEDSEEMAYLLQRRTALGGYLPSRRRRSTADPGRTRPVRVRRPAGRHPGPADLHHDGVRPDPEHAAAGQDHRAAGGADRAGRVPHVRDGGHVPAVRHLQPGRPAVPAGGRQPADVLPGGAGRPDAAGGHQRARRAGVLDRRGHRVQHQRHRDDPVLHLLLDVRLPAGDGPDLGGRRLAGARLPARRDGRPDHAQRRGAAARGRAQPRAGLGRAELRGLRPDVLLRGRGHHRRTGCGGCSPSRRTCSSTSR